MSLIDITFNQEESRLPGIDFIQSRVQADYRNLTESFEVIRLRKEYIKNSFMILNHEFLVNLKKTLNRFNLKKIAELSCGIGWFTFWLRKYRIKIEASVDNMSWHLYCKDEYLSHVMKYSSISYVKQHPEIELFILSWPYMDSVATRTWNVMKENQYLLFIGEGYGGCTANESFFKKTEDHEIKTDLSKFFISFNGIHDNPFLYRK